MGYGLSTCHRLVNDKYQEYLDYNNFNPRDYLWISHEAMSVYSKYNEHLREIDNSLSNELWNTLWDNDKIKYNLSGSSVFKQKLFEMSKNRMHCEGLKYATLVEYSDIEDGFIKINM